MTLPYERSLSVTETGQFLVELSRNQEIPEVARRRAKELLRHYPTEREMQIAGDLEQRTGSGLRIFANRIDVT